MAHFPQSIALARGLLAALLLTATGAQAQNLLKPGQGLVGAPTPIEAEQPKPKDTATVDLPAVEVEGKRDALSESDRRLREKKKKLPGLGDDKLRKKGTAEKAIDAYNKLEKDPNKLDQDTQDFLERTVKSPDTNHRDDYVTLPRRDGADYVDPIAAQQGGKK